MGVDDGEAAAALTAEQVVASAEGLSQDDDASTQVTVTQSWAVGFVLAEGQNASELAALLEAACQASTPGCTLVSGGRLPLDELHLPVFFCQARRQALTAHVTGIYP